MPPALRSAFLADRYNLEESAHSGYHAWNAANRMYAGFPAGATDIQVNHQRLRLTVVGFGSVTRTSASGTTLNRVYASGLREWFSNGPRGLEQGFVLEKRRGARGLTIRLGVSADWKVSGTQDRVVFMQGNVRLDYAGLKAWDSRGVAAPVRMSARKLEVVIEVDDSDAVYPLTVDPVFSQQQELAASDGAAGDFFGDSVALSSDGSTALVGAPDHKFGFNTQQGAAYVYTRTGITWSQQQELTASDGASGDFFGQSVALSGDGLTALISAPDHTIGSNSNQGSAYVFVRNGPIWTQQQELTAFDGAAGDAFGNGSVALSGNGSIALVGSGGHTVGANAAQGVVYTYTRTGAIWAQQQELSAPDGAAGDLFGYAAALSNNGTVVLVGAFLHQAGSNAYQGAAYVFTSNGAAWSQQQELTSSDGVAGDLFGYSVALSSDGSTLLVGAPGRTVGSNAVQGSAYAYTRSSTIWSQRQELTALDGAADDSFGESLALSNSASTALVGGPNKQAAYLFTSNGATWSQQQELTSGAGDGYFGFAVALSGDGLTVLLADRSQNQGLAFVFAPPLNLIFTTQPSNGIAGTPVSPVVVEVQDSLGNLVSSNALVTLTSSPAVVNVTVPAVNGVATFGSQVFSAAGAYTLIASSSGLVTGASKSFSISAANASKLAFTTEPSSGIPGTAISPVVVEVQDVYGNAVTASAAAVTLTSNPAAANATLAAVNGLATFSNIVFNATGTYTMTAGSPGLNSAGSNPFTITSPERISGQATVSGAALSGVTINVSGTAALSVITDSSGNYSVALPAGGAYTLSAALAGYSFNGPVTFSNLNANQTANFSGIAVAGLDFFAITPCRVVDTRAAAGFTGQFGPPSLAAGSTRTFVLPAGSCGIPATASAYSLNFTVVPPAGGPAANLTTWPAGLATGMPNVSTLNFSGGAVANAAIVRAGTNGAIDVFVNDPTDMLLDINGYFAPPLSYGLEFVPVTPCRVADTRTGTGFTGQFGPPSMPGGTTRVFVLPASSCGIPATASAYSLNFTVVPPTGGPAANLTTWPAGLSGMPNVSTLSYSGSVVANAAIVLAGANDGIDVYVNDPTDMLFDVNGYFASTGLHFYPVTPCRVADTRSGAGFTGQFGPPSLAAGATRIFTVPASTCGIPPTASAYSLNFTVIPPAGGLQANLTTWPAGLATGMPGVSTLNYTGSVVANAAIVPAGTNGAINVYVDFPTDVLFDINGYFAP